MQKLKAVYKGSVNRWECDENDHLNVRFYVHKMQQALESGLIEVGLANYANIADIRQQLLGQHMRYLAEARIAVALSGYFALVEANGNRCTALVELRNSLTDRVLAAFTYEFLLSNNSALDKIQTIELPSHAGPRGITQNAKHYHNIRMDECVPLGFFSIGRGVIQPEECAPDRIMQLYQYIGRASDSMPNLWSILNSGNADHERGDGQLGGAVLEYRLDYFKPHFCVGDHYEIFSGVLAVGEKTQQLVHLFFNLETRNCVAAAQSIGVGMDLQTRRAIAIPEARRKFMQGYLLKAR